MRGLARIPHAGDPVARLLPAYEVSGLSVNKAGKLRIRGAEDSMERGGVGADECRRLRHRPSRCQKDE